MVMRYLEGNGGGLFQDYPGTRLEDGKKVTKYRISMKAEIRHRL
jgi:hypothetical protein